MLAGAVPREETVSISRVPRSPVRKTETLSEPALTAYR
jgi:hypothetical protein